MKLTTQSLQRIIALLTVTITFLLATTVPGYATHIAGADLTYQHISGNTYQVTITYYRDCAGNNPIQQETLRIRSASCGQDFTAVLPVVSGTGLEITFPCASGGSTCSGGSAFGVQKWSYSGTVTLPSACNDWIFSWDRCCRNCAITTTIHGNCNNDPQSNIYVESTLNNLDVSDNNSPTFSNDPVATLCLNQNFVYNHGVVDPDGDSLVYSVVGSKVASGTNVTYQPGYSDLNPISSIPALGIDATTGDLSMTPQLIEIGVMAVKVDEYRAGILIGSVTRDMQFIVQNCNNTLPTATGMNGTADFDTLVCAGSTVCFYIFTNDGDAGQSLLLTSNNAIPGSSFQNSGGSHPTASFCWSPTQADARQQPYTFTVTVRDDACPTNGLQTYSFSITVPEIALTVATDDTTGSIDLMASGNSGPYTYAWSGGQTTEDLTGLYPGTYTATVCDVNGCCNTIQATITKLPVVCTISASAVTNDTTGSIDVTVSGGSGALTYSWSGGETTEDLIGLVPGTYTLAVCDTNGCCDTLQTVINPLSTCNFTLCVTTKQPTCNNACDGWIKVTPHNGVAPYTYLWSNGATTQNQFNLCAGTYCVTVTDANGCVAQATETLINPPANIGNSSQTNIGRSIIRYAFEGTALPNPFYNYFEVMLNNEDATLVNIFSISGVLLDSYPNVYNGDRLGENLPNGLYIIQLQQGSDVVYLRMIKQNNK